MTRNRRVDGAVRAALVVVALMLMACPAFAQLRLDVTRGKVEPMPIAIPAFAGGGGEEAQTGRDMAQVISADLERSGLFRPLDPQSFIQNVSAGEGPRFGDWRQINAQALVSGTVHG
jgi:TolB protein